MKELSKHTSKAQIAGESQTLFCEDLTIASLQPIAMIVIDIFSSWYVCHHLSTKLDISMAAYIDLTEEIIADLHPEVVYIFDAVSEGFHLQVDETKTTKTTKTTNIKNIWFHMINDRMTLPMCLGHDAIPQPPVCSTFHKLFQVRGGKNTSDVSKVMETSDFQDNLGWHGDTSLLYQTDFWNMLGIWRSAPPSQISMPLQDIRVVRSARNEI